MSCFSLPFFVFDPPLHPTHSLAILQLPYTMSVVGGLPMRHIWPWRSFLSLEVQKSMQIILQLMGRCSSFGITEMINQLSFCGATSSSSHKSWTPLHLAAWEGKLDACKYLLSVGGDACYPDWYGQVRNPMRTNPSDSKRSWLFPFQN
jgi:hypothetical protein